MRGIVNMRAAALALGVALAGPAAAQSLIFADDLYDIEKIADEYGTASFDVDDRGFPKMSGEIEGIKYWIYFYGCNDAGKGCSSIQFASAWESNGRNYAPIVSRWNRDKRFGKAYVDDNGNPRITVNVAMTGGLNESNLVNWFGWWDVVLKSFRDEL